MEIPWRRDSFGRTIACARDPVRRRTAHRASDDILVSTVPEPSTALLSCLGLDWPDRCEASPRDRVTLRAMRVVALWIVLLAVAASAAEGRLEKRPCWFEYEPKQAGLRVECAVLHVPERWSDAASRREVSLPVVVLRARQRQALGHTGARRRRARRTARARVRRCTDHARESRVVRDRVARRPGARGPARRRARAAHVPLRRAARGDAALARCGLSVAEEAALWADAARRVPHAPREAGDRARRLRLPRGARRISRHCAARSATTQWNAFGTSYAGEIALEYARAFPSAVRALVLDSPSIPGADLFAPGWFAERARSTVRALCGGRRCARDFRQARAGCSIACSSDSRKGHSRSRSPTPRRSSRSR